MLKHLQYSELLFVVNGIDPDITGITGSWANVNISDAELGMNGYTMFWKNSGVGQTWTDAILHRSQWICAVNIVNLNSLVTADSICHKSNSEKEKIIKFKSLYRSLATKTA